MTSPLPHVVSLHKEMGIEIGAVGGEGYCESRERQYSGASTLINYEKRETK